MSFLGFGKNDRSVMSGGDLEFYKGERNRTDLISLCWFFEDEKTGEYQMGREDTPKFLSGEIHYVKGLGYILDNPYLRDKLGPPKRKIGTFVVHYRTDKQGNLMKPFEYEVKPWTFGEDKFRQLAEINKDFPLTSHDIKVVCTDDQFQKMTFYPSPKESVWRMKDSLRDEVLSTVKSLSARLSIGREVPLDDLKEHFGDSRSPVPDVSSDVGYDDLLDGIE
jgi:hypothetical protein